jgi:hypothetical protein
MRAFSAEVTTGLILYYVTNSSLKVERIRIKLNN